LLTWDEDDDFSYDEQSDSTEVKIDNKKVIGQQVERVLFKRPSSYRFVTNFVVYRRLKMHYFNKGMVYMNKIKDNEKAIETFEEFALSDLMTVNILRWYIIILHNLYLGSDNISSAEKYKQLLISEHPDSKYTKALTNPNFLTRDACTNSSYGTSVSKYI
jgi:hypothetical protein